MMRNGDCVMSAATKPVLMLEALRRGRSVSTSTSSTRRATRVAGTGTGPIAFALTHRVVRYAPADVTAWKSTQSTS
jgi:hypothetical protein